MPSNLTVDQLKTEIRSAFGGRTDFDTRLDIILGLAQRMLARMHDFDELRGRATINTAVTGNAANDKIIALTTLYLGGLSQTLRKIYDIRLFATGGQSRKLTKIMPRRWDKLVPESEYYSRGKPTHYVQWKRDEIELWRVPDAVYTMHFRYFNWPAAIGAGGTFLTLENVDDLLINLACSYLALSVGHLSRSNDFYRAFANGAAEALKEDIEDYDTHMAVYGQEIGVSINRGYDDPFLRSMPI